MTTIPGLSHDVSLLVFALIAVIGLILLIARFKLNAFVALILASLFVGLCAGMGLLEIVSSFQEGVGALLGSIAIVIGLGTILGKMLAESGGAEVVANTLLEVLGERRVHWTMLAVGFVVGITVWFSVGLVLLIPIVFTIAKSTRTPLLVLGLPLVAGLSVTHSLVPPHPGPMAAIARLQADAGKTILYSLIIGLPAAVIAGPLVGTFIGRKVLVALGGMSEQLTQKAERKNSPGFALTLFTILLPVLLMLMATVADITLAKGHRLREWIDFAGSPLVAMLVAVLFSFYSFGWARGFEAKQILKFTEDCLGPVAGVLLVVGAGGGFSRVLVASGVGKAIAGFAQGAETSPLVLGWLVAMLIRVATGSATVAITTAAGIIAEYAHSKTGTNMELLVVAMGAGSLILSHLNDGGFWFVKEYFNLTVTQTLKTWTVIVTVASVVALLLTLLLNKLV
jgi:GntP family gluconate:H+ symporter